MASWLDSLFGTAPAPNRRVFFSLHYQRDIWRAQQVKKHWVAKEDRQAAGFFDASLEEKAKKEGDEAVKRLIDKGLIGASVTCVLIGASTHQRRWVRYEIFRSVERGMGVFGVRIHKLKDQSGEVDSPGESPFEYLGYGTEPGSEKLRPKVRLTSGWKDAPYNRPITKASAPYFEGKKAPVLSDVFRVYDWVRDNGFSNFSKWVSAAAEQAQKKPKTIWI